MLASRTGHAHDKGFGVIEGEARADVIPCCRLPYAICMYVHIHYTAPLYCCKSPVILVESQEVQGGRTGHAHDKGVGVVEAEAREQRAQARIDVGQAALGLGDRQPARGQRRAGHRPAVDQVQIHHVPVRGAARVRYIHK